MIKLVVDIGNTQIKAATWRGKRMMRKYDHVTFSMLRTRETYAGSAFPDAVIIATVRQDAIPQLPVFTKAKKLIMLDHRVKVPVNVKYRTPETLGNDRLANAVGGAVTFPGLPVLVVDAGTCIKYDFVDADGSYAGGSIAPGLQMRFDALHHFTARLPQIGISKKIRLTGRTTAEAMVSGVQFGAVAEVEGIIGRYREKHKKLRVILTGGDCRFFAGMLKKHIFVAPNLTLLGLNEILDHNIS